MAVRFLADPKSRGWDCHTPGPDGRACRENPGLLSARNCGNDYGDRVLEFSGSVHRACPYGSILDAPWILDAWNDYVMLERFGILPRAGGIDDQSNRWVQALFVIQKEIERINAERSPG